MMEGNNFFLAPGVEEKAFDDIGTLLDNEDFEERKIFLEGEITQESVYPAIRRILKYNKEDEEQNIEKRTPIKLYISSSGGDLLPGIGLVNVIQNSKTPIYTINLSHQYSAGFLIGLAGHKRFTMRNASFLLHDGETCVDGTASRAYDQMKFYEKMDDRIKHYVLEHSTITEEEYDKNIRREWYLFGDEAKQKGFTDYIIDEDCNISAII